MVRGGRRKTGRQDWTLEGLMALETGLFVLLHVPDSHSFRSERSQLRAETPSTYKITPPTEFFIEVHRASHIAPL